MPFPLNAFSPVTQPGTVFLAYTAASAAYQIPTAFLPGVIAGNISSVQLYNKGTLECYIRWGTSTLTAVMPIGVATPGDYCIPPGLCIAQRIPIAPSPDLWIAVIGFTAATGTLIASFGDGN